MSKEILDNEEILDRIYNKTADTFDLAKDINSVLSYQGKQLCDIDKNVNKTNNNIKKSIKYFKNINYGTLASYFVVAGVSIIIGKII